MMWATREGIDNKCQYETRTSNPWKVSVDLSTGEVEQCAIVENSKMLSLSGGLRWCYVTICYRVGLLKIGCLKMIVETFYLQYQNCEFRKTTIVSDKGWFRRQSFQIKVYSHYTYFCSCLDLNFLLWFGTTKQRKRMSKTKSYL